MRFSPTLFIAALFLLFTPLFTFALPYPNPPSHRTMSTEKLKGVDKLKDKCSKGWSMVKVSYLYYRRFGPYINVFILYITSEGQVRTRQYAQRIHQAAQELDPRRAERAG